MLDFSRIEQYRENNRIEAKRALGGLPKSIWETYSAFANTYGGIILLGVVEWEDKSLHPVNLPDPERLIREFWEIVNDPRKTSANILSARDVFVQEVGGNHIVVIQVPRAERFYKPVYVDGSPYCTYRRSGEGDYRCTREEYQAMLRDASVQAQDMRVLESMDRTALCPESIRRYRQRLHCSCPGHPWEALTEEAFLLKLGAAGTGTDGAVHPTVAGLLLFGNAEDIVREFPAFSLRYQEETDPAGIPGQWNGNVLDFFFTVYARLLRQIPGLTDGSMAGESVAGAVQEALTNCLINADYYGHTGVMIRLDRDRLILSNPGSFRIGIETAKSGGVSDPRNAAMSSIFHRIDIGKRTGSGIPGLLRIWREQGWTEPHFTEQPEQTTLTLIFGNTRECRAVPQTRPYDRILRAGMKEAILLYLTDHAEADAREIAAYLDRPLSQTNSCLHELLKKETLTAEDSGPERCYRLKA